MQRAIGARGKMSVKVLDAGGKVMLSGDLRAEVEATLDDYLGRGAKLITAVEKLGPSWIAACTLPTKTSAADTTTTLRLNEILDASVKQSGMVPEFDDACTVEELGFKRIITGPSRQAVELRIEHMKQFGAELIGEIEQLGNQWTAVVDTGGADKTYRG